jgi:glycosyltransferase involved in cell wall biosynthesis
MTELSVVIPTYNRADPLRACLEALYRQTYPAIDYEVIVVVDGSVDGTIDMLHNLEPPFQLRIIEQENRGQPSALNRGLEEARGEYCLFLDDDIIASPQLIAEHMKVQSTAGGVVCLGPLPRLLPPHANGFARYLAQWAEDHYRHLGEETRQPSFMDCYSGNLSTPRSALLSIAGFSTDLRRSFDIELGYRLLLHGLRIVYDAQAIGYQEYRKSFIEIAHDTYHAGTASVTLYRRYPAILSHLELGRFAAMGSPARELRDVLLALHVPAWLLALPGGLVPGDRRKRLWYRFLYSYFFWSGVRRAQPDKALWRSIPTEPRAS